MTNYKDYGTILSGTVQNLKIFRGEKKDGGVYKVLQFEIQNETVRTFDDSGFDNGDNVICTGVAEKTFNGTKFLQAARVQKINAEEKIVVEKNNEEKLETEQVGTEIVAQAPTIKNIKKEIKKYECDVPLNTNIDVMAQKFVDSGLFSDVRSATQAFVKIQAGREVGMSPVEAMQNVYLIRKKESDGSISTLITYKVTHYMGRLQASGVYDYKILVANEKKCEIEFFKLQPQKESLGISVFTEEDAVRIGLKRPPLPGKRASAWIKYTDQMLVYRAFSKGIKMFCPSILSGGLIFEDNYEIEAQETEEKVISLN